MVYDTNVNYFFLQTKFFCIILYKTEFFALFYSITGMFFV